MRTLGFPEQEVRQRAVRGAAAAFPAHEEYGRTVYGASAAPSADELDVARLVPPVFVPRRLEKLIDLGREPLHTDVDLTTAVGGFNSALPVYLSAIGSTRVAIGDLGLALARSAARSGAPMVIGENVVPMHGYGRMNAKLEGGSLLDRLRTYAEHASDGSGGVVIQQSTEDADAEVWNLTYSDPSATVLLDSGRLAFELKVGQGAKPGLGGMTLLSRASAAALARQYCVADLFGAGSDRVLRCASPGTFTDEILRQQIQLMRNNFPRARVWVKLPPARDVGAAAAVAWAAGADAVTVDGAEGGTGWAPNGFLDHVGLPLAECLHRIGHPTGCLLASGRMWAGPRAVKAFAMGATAVGIGRAAMVAADEDPEYGVDRLLECLALEIRLLVSALGKYTPSDVDVTDLWLPNRPSPAGGRVDESPAVPDRIP